LEYRTKLIGGFQRREFSTVTWHSKRILESEDVNDVKESEYVNDVEDSGESKILRMKDGFSYSNLFSRRDPRDAIFRAFFSKEKRQGRALKKSSEIDGLPINVQTKCEQSFRTPFVKSIKWEIVMMMGERRQDLHRDANFRAKTTVRIELQIGIKKLVKCKSLRRESKRQPHNNVADRAKRNEEVSGMVLWGKVNEN